MASRTRRAPHQPRLLLKGMMMVKTLRTVSLFDVRRCCWRRWQRAFASRRTHFPVPLTRR
ncbi:MAG: hypothetical protein SGI73_18130 [Chloroflexota bacterium]|nr:hypothetical protein [Chloroflexota bacterium]